MSTPIKDPLFRVELITATPNPQQACWVGMHQDYSEHFVADHRDSWPEETRAGEICVNRLLNGDRGHYGPLEHVGIVLNVGFFPHGVMQQARTHRIASFDVQSMRYTGDRICQASAIGTVEAIERAFYLRPVGRYRDRQGKAYTYSQADRNIDLGLCSCAAHRYRELIRQGYAEEHARGILPFDYRQHFVVSFSLRSLMHFLDLRSKADAQPEIQALCHLIWPHFQAWAPELAAWYEANRLGKARLAP